ncbi:MAG: L,D-transpeptidase family protein [Beijerinckiaceae bacterium]|nr:L,D-transpeptidase family protein [Beijerinckiaceae bacterium]
MRFDFRFFPLSLGPLSLAALLALASAPAFSQDSADRAEAVTAHSINEPSAPMSSAPQMASEPVAESRDEQAANALAPDITMETPAQVAVEREAAPEAEPVAQAPEQARPAAVEAQPVAEAAAPAAPMPTETPAPDQTAVSSPPIQAEIAPQEAATTAPEPPQPAVEAASAAGPNPIQLALRDAVERMKDSPIARAAPGQTPAAALRQERDEIAAVYQERDFAPLWIEGKTFTTAARAAVVQINRAREDGLDLTQYLPPTLDAASPDAMARAELALSQAAVGFARQASGVRVAPRVIGLISSKAEVASPRDVLMTASAARDAGEALAAYNPPHQGYRNLREKLAELRRERPALASPRIAPGRVLKVGMKDPRVPLVRARFGIDAAADGANSELVYDTRVASAVADFQRANGLPGNGALTARTIALLSGGDPARLEREILASMETWRWAPRDMGETRIEVNIPNYTARLIRDGKVVHSMRVIVGKPETPTPVFSDVMRFMVVNPSWHVPQSIIRKQLAQDPNYYARNGYEVVRKGANVFVRQPPGERNALGNVKFMFPNDHAVYMHDTPSRGLFNASRRAFSHGCVRVDQPFRFAEALMEETGWSEKRLRSVLGRGERTINFNAGVPVHMMYFTAFVDDEGKLQLRDDLYGLSRKLQAALGL